MSKKLILSALTAAAVMTCAGCSDMSSDISGKTYVYENGGFAGMGEFAIKLNADGTFAYYEGWASSYVGYGKWSVENGELVLSDDGDYGFVNRFNVDGGDLVFSENGSSNFLYVKVADGERFSSDVKTDSDDTIFL
ncbi:MAG: hypothetical protein HDT43_12740 [Ruminococcaceae bacterium]|nr:hypothetical protein [Oscillospiraceae bacterium]